MFSYLHLILNLYPYSEGYRRMENEIRATYDHTLDSIGYSNIVAQLHF